MNVPEYDELYVISDLHLGGSRGHQIFASTDAAVRFLGGLTQIQGRRIGLVINGDLVDFLAEDNAACFDPAGAAEKLKNIIERVEFAPVFLALQKFVGAADHYLTINLGNHDLELALPWVRKQLITAVAGNDSAAQGRTALILDGTGVRARVSAVEILCLHGNEVDSWNVTNFEKLRSLGRDAFQDRPLTPWKPNAGSRMVVEVMNSIKREWPFVDLLKPEKEAAVPILLSLNPELKDKLLEIAKLAAVASVDGGKIQMGFLGEPQGLPREGADPNLAQISREWQRALEDARRTDSTDALLDRVEERFRAGVNPVSLLGSDQEQAYLGVFDDAWHWVTEKYQDVGNNLAEWKQKKLKAMLLAALKRKVDGTTFDLKNRDDVYQGIDARVGAEFDIVITGHTHLERALPRSNGGYYFNGGTWAGLMALQPEDLADGHAFDQFYSAVAAGSLSALESAQLVKRLNTVVVVAKDDAGHVDAELRRATLNGGNFVLRPVANTQWRAS